MFILYSFLFITFLIIMLLFKNRRSVYKYDAAQSYNYDLSSADKTLQLLIQDSSLSFPERGNYDTAILEVEIRSNVLGHLLQPYLEIEQSGNRMLHYFEYGANGKRYIDISQNYASDEPIRIKGHHCSWINFTPSLYLFDNQLTNEASLCVIAPHPDDAEIAAFGLYSHCKNTYIITVSASESGQKMYNELGLSNYEQAVLKGRTRTVNSLSASILGGVKPQQCVNYGYFGSTLKQMFQYPDTIVTSKVKALSDMNIFREMNVTDTLLNPVYSASWISLVNDFKYSLEKIQPDIIVLPYPRIDTHNDHKYTTLAVFEALKAMDYQKGKLFLYTNHHVLSEAYPFGRIGSVISLPPHFEKPLFFTSIYSQKLDASAQVDKMMALESMNVLRPYYPWQKASKILNRVFKNTMNSLYGKRLDYFSRSVRSNELFFIIDVKDIYRDDLSDIFGKID
jgi:hypothetical protein